MIILGHMILEPQKIRITRKYNKMHIDRCHDKINLLLYFWPSVGQICI